MFPYIIHVNRDLRTTSFEMLCTCLSVVQSLPKKCKAVKNRIVAFAETMGEVTLHFAFYTNLYRPPARVRLSLLSHIVSIRQL